MTSCFCKEEIIVKNFIQLNSGCYCKKKSENISASVFIYGMRDFIRIDIHCIKSQQYICLGFQSYIFVWVFQEQYFFITIISLYFFERVYR